MHPLLFPASIAGSKPISFGNIQCYQVWGHRFQVTFVFRCYSRLFSIVKTGPQIQDLRFPYRKQGYCLIQLAVILLSQFSRPSRKARGTFLGKVDWGPYSSPRNHYRGNCSFHVKARLALPSTVGYHVKHTRAWDAKDLPYSCLTPF